MIARKKKPLTQSVFGDGDLELSGCIITKDACHLGEAIKWFYKADCEAERRRVAVERTSMRRVASVQIYTLSGDHRTGPEGGTSRSRQANACAWLAGLAVGTAVVSACVAVATADDHSRPLGAIKFDIPSEPLVEALQAYSVTTGTQVMFESGTTAGYQSAAVRGEFSPEAALQMMLADTGLKVRYTRASAITVAPASAPDVDDPPAQALATADLALSTLTVTGGTTDNGDKGRLGAYVSAIQADIQKALKNAARKTRASDYRGEAKLWIDPSRTIQRAELSSASGDKDRDASLAAALQGLVLSQAAPPNTPQPIRFLIAIRSL